jgi:hypothetical protein
MHTLAANIIETSFPVIGPNLILVLIQICNNLPCPECAQHAKDFWSRVKTSNIKTKDDLINLLFVFHNTVNKRKQLPLFKYENIQYYKTKNIVNSYNTFSRNFNTRGNMNLINESFRRNIMLSSLRAWMMLNLSHFEF